MAMQSITQPGVHHGLVVPPQHGLSRLFRHGRQGSSEKGAPDGAVEGALERRFELHVRQPWPVIEKAVGCASEHCAQALQVHLHVFLLRFPLSPFLLVPPRSTLFLFFISRHLPSTRDRCALLVLLSWRRRPLSGSWSWCSISTSPASLRKCLIRFNLCTTPMSSQCGASAPVRTLGHGVHYGLYFHLHHHSLFITHQ